MLEGYHIKCYDEYIAMTQAFNEYNQLLIDLREARRKCDWRPESDRPALQAMESLFDDMTEEEFDLANAEGWRGWPDLYDKRVKVIYGC